MLFMSLIDQMSQILAGAYTNLMGDHLNYVNYRHLVLFPNNITSLDIAKIIITKCSLRGWTEGESLIEVSGFDKSCVVPCAGSGTVNPLGGGWVLARWYTEVIILQQGSCEEEHIGAGQGLSNTAVFSCNQHLSMLSNL